MKKETREQAEEDGPSLVAYTLVCYYLGVCLEGL
jgi:hypothetical protein